jgi:hypothetical protein
VYEWSHVGYTELPEQFSAQNILSDVSTTQTMSSYQYLRSRFSSLVEVMLRVLTSRPRNEISPSSMGNCWSDDELRLRRSRRSEYWSNLSVVYILQSSLILMKLSCGAFNSHHVWSFLSNFCLYDISMLPQVFETRCMFTVFLNDFSQHSCYFFPCIASVTCSFVLLAADKYAWPISYCTSFCVFLTNIRWLRSTVIAQRQSDLKM